ncbi:MAG TPA: type IV secretion system DNA-binding domain-containing protein [Terracidiphilus sp.]|nr:type IV secretion system DNA-binding domain-containing protein [Terracidiphilus sp.]
MQLPLGYTQTIGGQKSFTIDLDRSQFRHGWLLGKSGTGKSTLLRNVIVAALREQIGVAVIDPHGDLIYDVFNYLPQDRLEDVVYIDPENDRAPDLGIFDHPDKEKAVQAFMSLMEAHSGRGWGPETAHILRGATDAVLELEKHPSILHIYKVLARDEYAKELMGRSENPLVQDFYKQYFEDLKPQERARNFSHPLNKVEELLRPGLREFLSQHRHLSFNGIMDRQKILLCRIPKGLIGERPAKVLGSLILSKINLASFRRKKRNRQFLVVVDEVHNFTDGIDFESMLAEGRKFGIHYLFATQTTQQMRDEERRIFNDRIAFGNTSHIFSFRVSGDDSEKIALNFGDKDIAESLVKLQNYHFVSFSMHENAPVLSDPVELIDKPDIVGDEVSARKAIEWAKANTGTEKPEIEKQISRALRK